MIHCTAKHYRARVAKQTNKRTRNYVHALPSLDNTHRSPALTLQTLRVFSLSGAPKAHQAVLRNGWVFFYCIERGVEHCLSSDKDIIFHYFSDNFCGNYLLSLFPFPSETHSHNIQPLGLNFCPPHQLSALLCIWGKEHPNFPNPTLTFSIF